MSQVSLSRSATCPCPAGAATADLVTIHSRPAEAVASRSSVPPVDFDPWAQELLWRSHRAILSGVRHALILWGRGADRQMASDLVQETYCRLLDRGGRRLRQIRGATEKECRRWLRRVAERVVLDYLRSRNCVKRGAGVHIDPLDEVRGRVADLREGPEQAVLRRDEMRSVVAACRRVTASEANARLVAMALIGGWSSRELARMDGFALSRTGIDSLVCRTRRRLLRDGFSFPLRYSM